MKIELTEEWLRRPSDDLKKAIDNLTRKRVDQLGLRDLTLINVSNGVYIFWKNGTCMYVGKCSSRHFVERIAVHFDDREEGWFNSMAKKLYKINGVKDFKETIKECLAYDLSLIGVREPDQERRKAIIGKLETICRYWFKPELNRMSEKRVRQIAGLVGNNLKPALQYLLQSI